MNEEMDRVPTPPRTTKYDVIGPSRSFVSSSLSTLTVSTSFTPLPSELDGTMVIPSERATDSFRGRSKQCFVRVGCID